MFSIRACVPESSNSVLCLRANSETLADVGQESQVFSARACVPRSGTAQKEALGALGLEFFVLQTAKQLWSPRVFCALDCGLFNLKLKKCFSACLQVVKMSH